MTTEFDETAARETLVAEGVHPALAECLIEVAIAPHQREWPHDRLLSHLRGQATRFGVREWRTRAMPGPGGGSPSEPYITVVLGDTEIERVETRTWIFRGDDVDAEIAKLQERFLPTVLPIIETHVRRARLDGQPIPAPIRPPPEPVQRKIWPEGIQFFDEKMP